MYNLHLKDASGIVISVGMVKDAHVPTDQTTVRVPPAGKVSIVTGRICTMCNYVLNKNVKK